MAWKKTDGIIIKRMNQRGLGPAIIAGQLCMQAETLYPGLFKAVSFRNGSLHLSLKPSDQVPFKLIQGKLQSDLNRFAETKNLPKVERIRLTFSEV